MDGSDLFVMESKYIETHDMHARLLVLYIHVRKKGWAGVEKEMEQSMYVDKWYVVEQQAGV